jgi:hypothetical protein
MIEIRPMQFPSANFPGADLRVNPDTLYTFKCESCGQCLGVPFGWVLGSEPDIDNSELTQVIHQHLEDNPHLRLGSHVDIVYCRNCGAAYVVQSRIDETSWGAYRVNILGVAQTF